MLGYGFFYLQVSCFMADDSWVFASAVFSQVLYYVSFKNHASKGRIHAYVTGATRRHCRSVTLQTVIQYSVISGDTTRMKCNPIILCARRCIDASTPYRVSDTDVWLVEPMWGTLLLSVLFEHKIFYSGLSVITKMHIRRQTVALREETQVLLMVCTNLLLRWGGWKWA